MTWQMVYWITRLDAIADVSIAFVVLSVLGFLTFLGLYISARCLEWGSYRLDSEEKKLHNEKLARTFSRWMVIFATIILLSSSCVIFLPSTKEACAIYLIPKIANNEQVQKIPENALRLLNAKLEEWIDEQIGDSDEKQD